MHIKVLSLYTNNIDKQINFYSDILGLKMIDGSSNSEISYQVGTSVLKFTKRDKATPYHFAFNIHSNKEYEALDWLKDRVSILKEGRNEILNFESWNAKGIYFYDEDKNIVEFIARKNLNLNSNKLFDINSLLEISEIGLPVISIENACKKLINEIGLPIYFGSFEEFCAIGDEHGLVICVDQTKKRWFPIFDKAYPSDFNTEIIQNGKTYLINYLNGMLNILQI